MKTKIIIYISLFVLLCCSNNSCTKKNKYPISLGEQTLVGKIVVEGNPCTTDPCLPCAVLWLKTTTDYYVLSIDYQWFCSRPIIVDGTEYSMDDEVEITGTVMVYIDINSEEYSNLEIETIRKIN